MANKPAFYRPMRDAAVQGLLEIHQEHGTLTDLDYRIAAARAEYTPRHLRRLVKQHLAAAHAEPDPHAATPWIDDPDVPSAVFCYVGNFAAAHRHLKKQGKNMPSIRTFQRHFKTTFGETMIAHARKGPQDARNRRVYLKSIPETRGYTYEIDHTEAPVWVIPQGFLNAERPWLTVVMDRATGYLLEVTVTFGNPNANTVRTSIVSAIRTRLAPDGQTVIGGAPVRMLWDRGRDFLSTQVTQSCLRLDVWPSPLPGHAPHLKGGVERLNRFIKENALAPLPGYIDAGQDIRGEMLRAKHALSQAAFEEHLRTWIDWYNTEHVHRRTELTPLQAWQQESELDLVEIPVERLWVDFLRSKDHKVGKSGVRFAKVDYVAVSGSLDKVFGNTVEVRYLPGERSFIEAFHQGRHIATCVPVDSLSPDDRQTFLQARNEAERAARKALTADIKRKGQDPDAYRLGEHPRSAKKKAKDIGNGNKRSTRPVTDPTFDLREGSEEAAREFQPPQITEQGVFEGMDDVERNDE
jgi:putative transposase